MLGPEDKVIEIKEFNGIWARGNPDEVPGDHLIDCQNLALVSKSKAITRSGLNTLQPIPSVNGHVVRFFESAILPLPITTAVGDQLNMVTLDDLANLWFQDVGTPLLNIPGMSDFAGLNMFNRCFIAPNDGRLGFPTGNLQILYNYNNTYLIRNAAGFSPRGPGMTAANTTNAGNIPVGARQFAVIYVTDTGYQTQPGPKSSASIISATNALNVQFTSGAGALVTGQYVEISGFTGAWSVCNGYWAITSTGAFTFTINVDSTSLGSMTGTPIFYGVFDPTAFSSDGIHTVFISTIPTGPSYVVQRILLATQSGGTEFFYIPNGTISDNTTTSLEVDFYDTDLVISADELFNLLEVIPGGTGLCNYNGRLVLVGAFFFNQTALVSNEADPESFDTVTGYVPTPITNDDNNVVACAVLRDILYLFRAIGFWNAQDNGGDPSTWPVVITDLTVGSYQNGLCGFTTTQSGASDTGDILLITSKEGIYIFDGVVRRPELTMKIQDIWSTIPLAYGSGGLNNVQVSQSVWTHQLFIAYPSTPTSSYADALLVGDYDPIPGVLDPIGIRWSRFVFPWTPTCIKTGLNLVVGSVQNNPGYLFILDPTQANDYGSAPINCYLKTFLATAMPGWVNFFKAFRVRINANGTVTVSLYGEDNVLTESTPAVGYVLNTLAGMTTPAGKEFLQLINFVNEKMSMQIGTNALNANMNLNRIELFCLPRWQVRPG